LSFELRKRCQLPAHQGTPAERALTDAGWISYFHFDRQLVQGEVEIPAGMTAADGMCGPAGFNVFLLKPRAPRAEL